MHTDISRKNHLPTSLILTWTHTHPFNGFLSRTTRVSRYQKGKTNLDFTEARDSEWQWHQLGYMQVCTSLQTNNQASTSPLSFLQAGCPSCRPTNSVKALKAVLKWTQLTSVSTVHTQLRIKNAQCTLISVEKKPLANITNSNKNKTRSMNVSVDWQNIRHQQLTSVMSRDAAAALMCKLGWRTALVVSSARENVPTALSQQSFIHHYHYHQHHNSTSGRLDAR